MDINKITFLLGPQSSGKSTIAKVLCHCRWIEKRCYTNFEEESTKFDTGTSFVDVSMNTIVSTAILVIIAIYYMRGII